METKDLKNEAYRMWEQSPTPENAIAIALVIATSEAIEKVLK